MADIKLNVNPDKDTITILQGKALDPVPPQKIYINGDIYTFSNFLSVRKELGEGYQKIDPAKAVVLVDFDNGTIELQTDPESLYGAVITSALQESTELSAFHINGKKTFSREELVKLLKFNRLFFESPDKHAELIKAFQKLSSSVQVSANASSDERGNRANEYIKNVTTNAPTEFILNISLFKGFANTKFRVEICLDVTDNTARFWFESVELHELIQVRKNEIFVSQLKSADGLVIIHK